MSTGASINPEAGRQPAPPRPLAAEPRAQPRFGRMDLGLDRVLEGIRRSSEWLLGLQHPDGYWCGELEADSMLEADYIFMHTLLGTGDRGKMERAMNEILRHQNEDGGWSLYPGGPSNVNYGVKCYLALKLMGFTADEPVLVKARECAEPGRRGGVQYLHQDLSLRSGPVRLRCGAGDSAGDRSVSELVLLQHLRDQCLVARHPGAAFDHLREEAVQEDPAGAGHRRAFRRRPRKHRPAPALGPQAPHLLA